jgi:hypothetical protein
MADKIPTRSEARQSAGLPVRASTAELAAMGMLTWLGAEPATARNPQTGNLDEGMQVQVQDTDGRKFTAYIGGVALLRELAEIADAGGFPFKSRIAKDGEGPGHPWVFVD